jgi:two-component system, OmpR family, phosphate regulon response regulator PhoB
MENRPTFQKSTDGEREDGAKEHNVERSKTRILTVDDSPDALTLLRLFFSAEGFEVITAAGMAEALLRMREQLPDLIITDYAMVDRSGLDLCRHLRSHRETRHIPIVVHTATDLPPTKTPLYDALCEKPAGLAQLARRVRSLLDASRDRRPSQH